MEWDEMFASVDGPAYLTGEINADGRTAFEAARDRSIPVILAPPAYRLRRAGFVAEEAWERLRAGKETFEAVKLIPIYIPTKDVPMP
jgi:hypothetical protein